MSQFKQPYVVSRITRPMLLAYASMPPAGEPGQEQSTPPASYGYPPVVPQPQMTPPPGMMPPRGHRKRNIGIGCGAVVLLIIIIAIIAAATSGGSSSPQTSNTSITQPTDTPTQDANAGGPVSTATVAGACGSNCGTTQKWTTTHTFSGNGMKKTEVFTVSDDWKLSWKCDPASDYFGSYNVIVDVYNADGSYADGAINTICRTGNTSGVTEEHQGGQVYLDINSEDAWSIQIQEMQ